MNYSDIHSIFDFSSPYGYLAVAEDRGARGEIRPTVDWHPMLLGVVFKQTGAAPLTMVPLKGDYSRRDFERSARFHGIEFRMPPEFPDRRARRRRGSCSGCEARDPAVATRVIKALYRAFFVDGVDISDPDIAADVAARRASIAEAARAAVDDPAIKDALKREVEQAIARGVFGSPFVFVDGEPFWGLDRFDQVERWLSTRRLLTGCRMAEYMLHCFAQSGNAYKPALALELAGADWAPRFVDYFSGETRTPAYRAINVMGEVPVLEHRGSVLSQSGVILDYLADTLGQFGPRDDAERREILRWLLWDNHKLTSYTATYRFMRTFVKNPDPAVLAEFRKRAETAWGVLDAHLAGRRYVVARPADDRRSLACAATCSSTTRSASTGAPIRTCATGSRGSATPRWVIRTS